MAIRIVQGKLPSSLPHNTNLRNTVCGLWFWVAFTFFIFVALHQSHTHTLIPLSLPERSLEQTIFISRYHRLEDAIAVTAVRWRENAIR